VFIAHRRLQLTLHVGVGPPRMDGADPHLSAHLLAQGISQRPQGELGTGIDPPTGAREEPGPGVDGHHNPPSGLEGGQKKTGEIGDGEHICLENLAPECPGCDSDVIRAPDASGVDQHIQPPDPCAGRGERSLVRQVANKGRRVVQLGDQLPDPGGITTAHQDPMR